MPDHSKLRKVYNKLMEDGNYNLPSTYEQFEADMSDNQRLQTVYTKLRKDRRYNMPTSYLQFKRDMGFYEDVPSPSSTVNGTQPFGASPSLGGTAGSVFNTARQIISTATAQPQQPATPVSSTTQPATAQPQGPRVPRTLTPEEQMKADRIKAKAASPKAPMSSYGQQVAERRKRQEVGKYDKQVQPYDLSKGLGYTYSTVEGYNPEIREDPSAGSNNISNVQPYDPSKALAIHIVQEKGTITT